VIPIFFLLTEDGPHVLRFQSARELQAAILGQEFAAALKRINHWVSEADESSPHPKVGRRELLAFGSKMKDALRDIWKEPPTDVFNIGFDHF
jgi:cohesin loading factor subunit SCC2